MPARRVLGLSPGPGVGGRGQRLAVSPPVRGSTWLEKHQGFQPRALAGRAPRGVLDGAAAGTVLLAPLPAAVGLCLDLGFSS